MADQKQYNTLQWYEYRNYTMNNPSDYQMTIDEYFEYQDREKGIAEEESEKKDNG